MKITKYIILCFTILSQTCINLYSDKNDNNKYSYQSDNKIINITRIESDFGYGLYGGISYSFLSGDMNIPNDYQLIGEEQNDIISFKKGNGYSIDFGFKVQFDLNNWDYLISSNLLFNYSSHNYNKDEIFSETKKEYNLKENSNSISLSLSFLKRIFTNYYTFFEIGYDKMIYAELKEKEIIRSSSNLEYEYNIPVKNKSNGFFISLGTEYYYLTADISNKTRAFLQPSLKFSYRKRPYSDYNSSVNSFSVELGLSLQFFSDKLIIDTALNTIDLPNEEIMYFDDGSVYNSQRLIINQQNSIKSEEISNVDIKKYKVKISEAPSFSNKNKKENIFEPQFEFDLNNIENIFKNNQFNNYIDSCIKALSQKDENFSFNIYYYKGISEEKQNQIKKFKVMLLEKINKTKKNKTRSLLNVIEFEKNINENNIIVNFKSEK